MIFTRAKHISKEDEPVNGQTRENLASGKPVIFLFLFYFLPFLITFFLGGRGGVGGGGRGVTGLISQASGRKSRGQ